MITYYTEPQIDLMNCVIEPLNNKGGLFVGSLEAASDLTLLKVNNIQYVLSLCTEAQIKYHSQDKITHKYMLIEDLPNFDIFSIFEQAHCFISQGRKLSNVLVHCIVGASRSPTVVISYLMKKWGMTLEDALAHLIAVRPIINPNVGFIQQLLEYELLLFKRIYSQLTHELTFFYYVQQQNSRYQPYPLDQIDSPFYKIKEKSTNSTATKSTQESSQKKKSENSSSRKPSEMNLPKYKSEILNTNQINYFTPQIVKGSNAQGVVKPFFL